MANWYRTGTVSVSTGSNTVTGSGTAWVANAKVGEEFRLLNGDGYEIEAIVSDTELTLARNFTGSTQSGQSYEIVPIKGFLKAAYDALQSGISTINGHIDGALSGRFGDGSAGAPAISFLSNTSTGLYRAAANQMGLATNGIRRVLLTTSEMQVDVPITGSAVQSDDVDHDLTKLMKVGAFGLGDTAAALSGGDNLSDRDMQSGFYSFGGTTQPGGPESLPYAYSMLAHKNFTGRRRFLVYRDGSTQAECFAWIGEQQGDNSILWHRIVTQETGVVGAVAQTAGTPTGKIIERGSNASGEYVKFADGTMQCWRIVNHDLDDGQGQDWSFPVTFVGTVAGGDIGVNGGTGAIAQQWSDRGGVAFANGTTKWVTRASIGASAGNGDTIPIHLFATGRWF
ncbi:hypothetical protein [Salipiger abyssi]|uniref:hypothetical protein n=1 Tax=Salipiger abyssi TaxID=1250539 RepID=UPI0009761053|nr:hypothetical protein [Salipiger abyssi]